MIKKQSARKMIADFLYKIREQEFSCDKCYYCQNKINKENTGKKVIDIDIRGENLEFSPPGNEKICKQCELKAVNFVNDKLNQAS